jgi:plastocyanin
MTAARTRNVRRLVATGGALALLMTMAACGDDKKEAASSTGTSGTSGTSDSSGTAGTAGGMITMKNLAFTPKDITVKPGEQVMVMNADTARHNLEDKDSKGKKFSSGDLEAGKDGRIMAPSTPGDYTFFCKYHFGMEGVLHVK